MKLSASPPINWVTNIFIVALLSLGMPVRFVRTRLFSQRRHDLPLASSFVSSRESSIGTKISWPERKVREMLRQMTTAGNWQFLQVVNESERWAKTGWQQSTCHIF